MKFYGGIYGLNHKELKITEEIIQLLHIGDFKDKLVRSLPWDGNRSLLFQSVLHNPPLYFLMNRPVESIR